MFYIVIVSGYTAPRMFNSSSTSLHLCSMRRNVLSFGICPIRLISIDCHCHRHSMEDTRCSVKHTRAGDVSWEECATREGLLHSSCFLKNPSYKTTPSTTTLFPSVQSEIHQRFCCHSHCLDSFTPSKLAFLSKPVEEAFNVSKSSIEPFVQPICPCSMEEHTVA
jgi:hypothetical protein